MIDRFGANGVERGGDVCLDEEEKDFLKGYREERWAEDGRRGITPDLDGQSTAHVRQAADKANLVSDQIRVPWYRCLLPSV